MGWEQKPGFRYFTHSTFKVGGSRQAGVRNHDTFISLTRCIQMVPVQASHQLNTSGDYFQQKVADLKGDGFLVPWAAGCAVRLPGDHGGGRRHRPVSGRHPCHAQVPAFPLTDWILSIYREQEVGSDQKGAKEEKISWDFLSSALPVISASVEELSWFGGPPKSNYPEFRFQLK